MRSPERSGHAGRLYLAHEVSARPGFDHVLTARFVPGSATDQAGRALADDVASLSFDAATPLVIRDRTDVVDDRLEPGQLVDGLLSQSVSDQGFHGFRVQVEVGREVYLEVDELK